MDILLQIFQYGAGSIGDLAFTGYGSLSDLFFAGTGSVEDAFGLLGQIGLS